MANRSRKRESIAPEGKYQSQNLAFEQTQMEIDTSTGELISHKSIQGRRLPKEPNYIKLYIDTMLSFQGIEGIPTDVIIAMSKCINGYNNDEETPLYFINNKLTKTSMAKDLGISENMVAKYIKKLNDAGVLVKTDMRSVYTCNPWIIARGSWNRSICGLRTHFNFINGEWQCDIEFKEDDSNGE